MIHRLPESKGHCIGLYLSAPITPEEQQYWHQQLEQIISKHQQLGLLLYFSSASVGVKTGWEDIRWLLEHLKPLNRLAIISTSSVWEWLIKLDQPFAALTGVHEKHFSPEDSEQAWQWLNKVYNN